MFRKDQGLGPGTGLVRMRQRVPDFTCRVLSKDMCRLKANGWRKIYHVTANWSKAGVALFLPDRADFKARKAIRDKAGHYIFSKKTQQFSTHTHLTTEFCPTIQSKMDTMAKKNR